MLNGAATYFWNSMSKTEQDHIVSAISFELGKCDDPIVHKNALNQINHVCQTSGFLV